jgi:hypothetical protein
MRDSAPSAVTREGADPQDGVWPPAQRQPVRPEDRVVYPGAGSELFHQKEKFR